MRAKQAARVVVAMAMATAGVLGLSVIAACGDDGAGSAGSTAGSGGAGGGGSGGAGGSGATTGTTSATTGAGGTSPACFDYDAFTPTPAVDFEADVLPVFAGACASSQCHGNELDPDGGMYLGEQMGNDAAIADAVYDNLVNVAAERAPALDRVEPGDASRSFLMIKLDGEFACEGVVCGASGCGTRMPRGVGARPLDDATRDVIRSWIQNGAERGGA